jgi:microcystin-dependent protein
MSCTNCFNGCSEITSDKCVKYTGADIPALGIQNGDTLQFVEQALAQFLISALDGSGIKPPIDPSIICNAVSINLPTCGEFTIVDLISGLIKSVCDLQDLITNVSNNLEILEGPYSEECLTVVDTTFSNTHNVLQAVIDQLCQTDELLATTILSLNNYVLESELANSVVAILEDEGLIGSTTKQYTKMIPYAAYPWFAPNIAGLFDGTGKGIPSGEYENVYLCNGNNPGVPDLRGRVPAGLTNGGMLGLTMNVEVDPSISLLNPTYAVGTRTGVNFVTLTEPQIASHSHIATSEVSPNPHDHIIGFKQDPRGWGGGDPELQKLTTIDNTKLTSQVDLTVTTTLTPTGQNQAHTNTQPTIGCYYIMYIPA